MAGYPFHLAPSEIMHMQAEDFLWWVERAKARVEKEDKANKA